MFSCSACLLSQTQRHPSSLSLFYLAVLFLYSFCFPAQTSPLSLPLSYPLSPCRVSLRSLVNCVSEMKIDEISLERAGGRPRCCRCATSDTCPAALFDFICLTFTCGREIHPAAHGGTEEAAAPFAGSNNHQFLTASHFLCVSNRPVACSQFTAETKSSFVIPENSNDAAVKQITVLQFHVGKAGNLIQHV